MLTKFFFYILNVFSIPKINNVCIIAVKHGMDDDLHIFLDFYIVFRT